MKKNNFTNNRDDRWYLNIMSPNTKGGKFAWLDPTSIYINTEAFLDLLDDLLLDLKGYDCDVVAGIDAMGFVLGSALAAKLGKGFLPIRKAGKLCVDTDKVEFINYSKRNQEMEIRFKQEIKQGRNIELTKKLTLADLCIKYRDNESKHKVDHKGELRLINRLLNKYK